MSKFRVLFAVMLAILGFAYARLELAQPARAPDIEPLRNQALQPVRAETSSKVAAVDIELLRHGACQSFNADAPSEAARVDGDVWLHFAYQAFNARANRPPAKVNVEVLRHNYYIYLRAAEADSAETMLDHTPETREEHSVAFR